MYNKMSNPSERILQYVKEELAAFTEEHEYEENKLHREIEYLTEMVEELEKKLKLAEKHKEEYREMWIRSTETLQDRLEKELENTTGRDRLKLIKELRSLEHM